MTEKNTITHQSPQAEGRLFSEEMSRVLTLALCSGLVDQSDTAIFFYDCSHLERRLKHIQKVFPAGSLHAVAIKANPLPVLLRRLSRFGVGAEAASLPELYLAEQAGFPPDTIVFDSPVKTEEEISYALARGVHINADSLAELDRIGKLLTKQPSRSTIGIRINPQIGSGSIAQTSVAGNYSKFGVPITEYRAELIRYFRDTPWLTGLHVHIGSQGCELPLLLNGVAVVYDFMKEVQTELSRCNRSHQIQLFDLGGGLPVAYHDTQSPPSMADYAGELRARFPDLFTGNIRLITEFGRYFHANAGWVASRVEYVKRDKLVNTLMVHVGADMFLRRCYRPEDWHHDISVVDSSGRLKTGKDSKRYTVAGPLCFSGDILARDIELPPVNEGDYILIHDAGAYTMGMWSRYNSRQMPKVIGYTENGGSFELLKDREQISKLGDFWQ